jgi:hypothetical protein
VDVTWARELRLIAPPWADCVTVAVVPVVLTEITVDRLADVVVIEVVTVIVARQFDSQLNTETGDKSPKVW